MSLALEHVISSDTYLSLLLYYSVELKMKAFPEECRLYQLSLTLMIISGLRCQGA